MAGAYWSAIQEGLQKEPPDIPAIGSNLHFIANHCAIESQAGVCE